jgi:hypothetical protein
MAWSLKGKYLTTCACAEICPCSVDGKPTTASGKCDAALVAQIAKGTLDGIDLSGVTVGIYFHLPSNFTSGNVRMGLVVDEKASDEQAKALERIFAGQEGGMFGEFVPLIAEFAQTERASLKLEGDTAKIGPNTLTFRPHVTPDGKKTTINNAAFGFAPEATIGTASGKVKTPFATFDQSFGEQADFEWA